MQRPFRSDDRSSSPEELCTHWEDLCSEYLPLTNKNSLWRHSRVFCEKAPFQGWKIHVSATVLSAGLILERLGPLLHAEGVYFKGAATLERVMQINSGIFFSYTQVGKIFTIYPESEAHFRSLVPRLAAVLPKADRAPAVPFDRRYKSSSVYYRYGAFRLRPTTLPGDAPSIVSPAGKEIPDERGSGAQVPDWTHDPFTSDSHGLRLPERLSPHILIQSCISQRGKGGVYLCLDTRENPPRSCILKEGRKNGELLWSGRDGSDRIRNEADILTILGSTAAGSPKVLGEFPSGGNHYLILERIEGVDIQRLINASPAPLSRLDKLKLSLAMVRIVSDIHDAGILWRDCKLSNFLVDLDENVRPIDFEGACRESSSEDYPWCTPLYMAPEIASIARKKIVFKRHHDLYALGICLHHLWHGAFPSRTKKNAPTRLGPDIPRSISRSIDNLLSISPSKRPAAGRLAELIGRELNTGI